MSTDSSSATETGKVSLLARLYAWWEGEDTVGEDTAETSGIEATDGPDAAGDVAGWPAPRLAAAQTLFGEGALSPNYQRLFAKQLDALNLDESSQVVDIAARAGSEARFIAGETGATVTGLEIDPALVELARQVGEQSGLGEKARVVEGSLGQCDIEPGLPNAIFGRDTLLTVADKDAAFLDIWSLLKPGGQILLLEFVAKKPDSANEEVVDWAAFEKIKPQLATVDQMKQGLAASHFDIHEAKDITKQACGVILRSLAGLADNLKNADLPKDQRPWMIWEVELWARRVNLLQAGNIGFYRFHASKADDGAE